jgi:hypothetical protein
MHNTSLIYAIECENIIYNLEETELETYAFTGTPEEIADDLFSGEGLFFGTSDFTDVITISFNTKTTKKKIFYQMVDSIGGYVEINGNVVNIKSTPGPDDGKQIRFGKNIIGINKIIESRPSLKTYYEIEMIEIKNSNGFELYKSLENIVTGERVRVIDEVTGLDIYNIIISMTYNPVFAKLSIVEISNTLERITDTINRIDTQAVKQDVLYNNASISADYGFRAERSDKKARATLGSDSLSFDVGDGLGAYTQALYFDPLIEKYKFVGDIEATGTITGANFIGGTINIGSGTFTVNSSGDVVANSFNSNGGTISGGLISGSVISGGTISGVVISGSTYTNPSSTGSFQVNQVGGTNVVNFDYNSNTTGSGPIYSIKDEIGSVGIYAFGSSKMSMGSSSGSLNGTWFYGSSQIATQSWVQSQGYLTSGSLSGYATTSYVNSYAVQDFSSQGIEMQFFPTHVEFRLSGQSQWNKLFFD